MVSVNFRDELLSTNRPVGQRTLSSMQLALHTGVEEALAFLVQLRFLDMVEYHVQEVEEPMRLWLESNLQ